MAGVIGVAARHFRELDHLADLTFGSTAVALRWAWKVRDVAAGRWVLARLGGEIGMSHLCTPFYEREMGLS